MPDLLDDPLDLLTAAHEPAERVTLPEPPELCELGAQRPTLEGVPHHGENPCGRDGLGQDVGRAEPHGLDRRRDVCKPREDDDRELRRELLQLAKSLYAVEPW